MSITNPHMQKRIGPSITATIARTCPRSPFARRRLKDSIIVFPHCSGSLRYLRGLRAHRPSTGENVAAIVPEDVDDGGIDNRDFDRFALTQFRNSRGASSPGVVVHRSGVG